jgi:PleD family two-component response regulator
MLKWNESSRSETFAESTTSLHFRKIAKGASLSPLSSGQRTAIGRRVESAILNDKVRVLVVENDQLIQAMVDDALSEGGFECVLTGSGEEAVALLKDKTHPERR